MRGKQLQFLAEIVTGAVLFGGGTAFAAGVLANPSWQPIYVDGEQVQLEAYNINGSNYVKLRDIGKAVGFNVYWDSENGCVQMDSTAPYTGEAPAGNKESDSTTEITANEEVRSEMIRLINEVRKENGVKELAINQSLMDAAQECSAHLFTSHHHEVECRTVLAHGYPHGFRANLTVFTSEGVSTTPQRAVTNWVNSKGHFEAMVDPDVDAIGVGVTFDNGRAFSYMIVGKPGAHNPYA